jgi:hypothetical protein
MLLPEVIGNPVIAFLGLSQSLVLIAVPSTHTGFISRSEKMVDGTRSYLREQGLKYTNWLKVCPRFATTRRSSWGNLCLRYYEASFQSSSDPFLTPIYQSTAEASHQSHFQSFSVWSLRSIMVVTVCVSRLVPYSLDYKAFSRAEPSTTRPYYNFTTNPIFRRPGSVSRLARAPRNAKFRRTQLVSGPSGKECGNFLMGWSLRKRHQR